MQIADGAAAIISSTAGRAALVSALRRSNTAEPLLPHVARTARALRPWQLEALVSDTETGPLGFVVDARARFVSGMATRHQLWSHAPDLPGWQRRNRLAWIACKPHVGVRTERKTVTSEEVYRARNPRRMSADAVLHVGSGRSAHLMALTFSIGSP